MSQQQQYDYLKKMDITVWRLRTKPNMHYFRCLLRNAAGKPAGCIVADIDQAMSIAEQENLLRKIAGALTDNIVIDQPIAANELLLENVGDFIVLLGDINAGGVKIRTIHSFSLSDLMHNADHKKTLWTELKTVKVFFDV